MSLLGTLVSILLQLTFPERLHLCSAFPGKIPVKVHLPCWVGHLPSGASRPHWLQEETLVCPFLSLYPLFYHSITLFSDTEYNSHLMENFYSSFRAQITAPPPGRPNSSGVCLLSSLQSSLGLTCLSSLSSASSTFLAHVRYLLNLHMVNKFRNVKN